MKYEIMCVVMAFETFVTLRRCGSLAKRLRVGMANRFGENRQRIRAATRSFARVVLYRAAKKWEMAAAVASHLD
jgi:hypothetical protein